MVIVVLPPTPVRTYRSLFIHLTTLSHRSPIVFGRAANMNKCIWTRWLQIRLQSVSSPLDSLQLTALPIANTTSLVASIKEGKGCDGRIKWCLACLLLEPQISYHFLSASNWGLVPSHNFCYPVGSHNILFGLLVHSWRRKRGEIKVLQCTRHTTMQSTVTNYLTKWQWF